MHSKPLLSTKEDPVIYLSNYCAWFKSTAG